MIAPYIRNPYIHRFSDVSGSSRLRSLLEPGVASGEVYWQLAGMVHCPEGAAGNRDGLDCNAGEGGGSGMFGQCWLTVTIWRWSKW